MSHPGNDATKSRLYEEALTQLQAEHPEVDSSEIEERFGTEAKEKAEDAFLYTEEGHPSLSAAERNR